MVNRMPLITLTNGSKALNVKSRDIVSFLACSPPQPVPRFVQEIHLFLQCWTSEKCRRIITAVQPGAPGAGNVYPLNSVRDSVNANSSWCLRFHFHTKQSLNRLANIHLLNYP